MQLSTAGHLEAVRGIGLLHPQGYVGVQLPEQPVADMAGGHIFSLLPCEGAVVYHEIHGDGGLGNFLEGDSLGILRRADGVSDVEIRDTGNGHDGADVGLRHIHFFQSVKFIELADPHFFPPVRIVVVYHHSVLVDFQGTVFHLADADAAHILVVVDGGDQHLGIGVRIAGGSRDVVDDGLKQRRHVFSLVRQIPHREALLGGGVDEGAVQLLVGGVQIHEKFQHLVHNLLGPCLGPVDLVDADHNRKIQIQRLHQHELGLGHGAFEGVHYQDDAVHHL